MRVSSKRARNSDVEIVDALNHQVIVTGIKCPSDTLSLAA